MRIKKTQRNKNKINPKIKIKKLGWKNNAATSRLCPTRLLDGRKVHRCFINTIRSLSSSSFLLFLFFCQNHYNLFSLLLLYYFPHLLFVLSLFSSLPLLLLPKQFIRSSFPPCLFFLSFFTLPAKTKQFYDLLLLYSFPPSFLFFFCQNNYNFFTTSFSSSSPFPFFLLLSLSLSLISEVGLICWGFFFVDSPHVKELWFLFCSGWNKSICHILVLLFPPPLLWKFLNDVFSLSPVWLFLKVCKVCIALQTHIRRIVIRCSSAPWKLFFCGHFSHGPPSSAFLSDPGVSGVRSMGPVVSN